MEFLHSRGLETIIALATSPLATNTTKVCQGASVSPVVMLALHKHSHSSGTVNTRDVCLCVCLLVYLSVPKPDFVCHRLVQRVVQLIVEKEDD